MESSGLFGFRLCFLVVSRRERRTTKKMKMQTTPEIKDTTICHTATVPSLLLFALEPSALPKNRHVHEMDELQMG